MFHVYILASGRNGTLYTGMTDDFARRVREREDGVTARYGVKLRVWREAHGTRESALLRNGGSRSGTGSGSWS